VVKNQRCTGADAGSTAACLAGMCKVDAALFVSFARTFTPFSIAA
jgi:hypothetical protein